MYKHLFLNPFYWYAVIWSVILLLSLCGFSVAYGMIDVGLIVFFLVTIAISLVMGRKYAQYVKKMDDSYTPPRRVKLCIGTIVLGFALDFLYAQSVPLWVELSNSEETYQDFRHFPILHVLIFTFAFFYAVNMFYHFLQEKDKKKRKKVKHA